MRVLGIETSCDETAAAVVDGGRVVSSVVSSQAEIHGRFYGVVPELASRAHQEKIGGVIADALSLAAPGAKLGDLADVVDAVAFTQGPGLAGALLVGKVAAQTLASLHKLPLIPVNHLEGHSFAYELEGEVNFPFVSMIVSGGHTDLVLIKDYGSYKVLGRTRDDAAGEAFDKVAKLLELGYPGGPIVDKLGKTGDPAAVRFPRPVLAGSFDFSFSGLKTAVLYHVQKHGKENIPDLCASFQEAVVETLTIKALEAAKAYKVKRVIVGGGVAANSRLRAILTDRCASAGVRADFPAPRLCTDNGAMIAHVGELRVKAGKAPKRASVEPALAMASWR